MITLAENINKITMPAPNAHALYTCYIGHVQVHVFLLIFDILIDIPMLWDVLKTFDLRKYSMFLGSITYKDDVMDMDMNVCTQPHVIYMIAVEDKFNSIVINKEIAKKDDIYLFHKNIPFVYRFQSIAMKYINNIEYDDGIYSACTPIVDLDISRISKIRNSGSETLSSVIQEYYHSTHTISNVDDVFNNVIASLLFEKCTSIYNLVKINK